MEEKPFTLLDSVILLMMVAPLDTLEFVLSPTGFAVLLLPFDLITSGIIAFWLIMKQDATSRLAARLIIWGGASLLDTIPIIEMIPARTGAILLVIWMSNHPSEENSD